MKCTRPAWRTTRKYIREAKKLWCKEPDMRPPPETATPDRGPSRLIWLPISKLRDIEWFDFRRTAAREDPKGGRSHVLRLAEAMRRCIPLPPAVGYHGGSWSARTGYTEGVLVLWDGNHRASAAKIAGVQKMPVLICGRTTR